MKRIPLFLSAASLAGCAQLGIEPSRPTGVERMYVIECGENHVKDVGRWTPGANAGKPWVFANHCYLIRHAKGGWLIWDTGNADRLAAMPNGLSNPAIGLTAYMKKPLAESLKQIGVSPAEVGHLALSHWHPDHSGNTNLFTSAVIYMQASEYEFVFGAEAQKRGVPVANFEKIRANPVRKLNGEHDVFGDGSVVIKATPGHTVGHQTLVVRLPRTGLVVLSGDMVHMTENWKAMRAPSFNFDQAASVRSMKSIEAYMAQSGAKLWINHDKEQNASVPKAPASVQ
jgi:glyoxylase-like metal-dependent hydrolase (beta-lactamase superfamily II)